MKVIHADHQRSYAMPGVPGRALRPVDIDAAITGFSQLRSLRVYHFNAGDPIDGHAEEDEVFVIVTSGTAEIKIGWEDAQPDSVGTFTLCAFTSAGESPCVAYLPPQSVYKLTPHTDVDVAYARATPTEDLEPRVFHVEADASTSGPSTLLSEQAHAQHLRLKLSHIAANPEPTTVDLRDGSNLTSESLVHLQSTTGDNIGTLSSATVKDIQLISWDTVALAPSESATLHVSPGSALAVLTVSAE